MGGREWADTYEPVLRLLFNLGFLGFSQSRLLSAAYLNDDPDVVSHVGNLETSESFLIHPAFRAALDTHDVTADQRRRDPF
jgi:hypothetical protein